MNRTETVELTREHVRAHTPTRVSGHDWSHIERVHKLALALGKVEGGDLYVIELASLLHDISDYKFNGGDLEKGSRVAYAWLREVGETESLARTVADIVGTVSFMGAGAASAVTTLEGMVVQDADRLDALGAIGVARAFAYGASVAEPMFDPSRPPHPHATTAEYLAREGSTVNHFHEKLLLLKDRMNTDTARLIAQRRHRVMVGFIGDFVAEWDFADAPELH